MGLLLRSVAITQQVPVVSAPSATTQATFVGASLTANFAAASVSATVNVNVSGVNMAGTTGAMSLPQSGSGPMTFSNYSSCPSPCNMLAQGLFTGPHAQFAGIAYTIIPSQTANLAPATIVGAVTFAR